MRPLKFILSCLILVCCMNVSCAPRQMQPAASPAEQGAYRLGTGDQLRVTVYGQPQITGTYTVDSNGDMSLPLIQNVPAKGLTLDELQNDIVGALKPRYLKDPKVSLEIISYRDIYVLGEVRNPGKFSYIPNMTVMQAIAVAGGHTYRANENTAEITRDEEGSTNIFSADVTSFVEPGDTIIVKRRWF